MKKNILLWLAALICTITSCKKETLISGENDTNIRLTEKLGSSRPLENNDPNLDPNWDWTQQSWTTYFNNANGSIGSVTTLNPFIDGSQKIYGNVDVSKADMYPSNGWMLVSRDFGTPTAANAYPFVILYNKYRGVMRVCILRTYDVLSSYQQITLSFAPNTAYPNSFVYSSTQHPYAHYYDYSITPVDTKNSDYKQTAITTAGVQEWMIADFDTKGYGSIPQNTSFNISMSEISASQVSLTGNMQLDGEAQPQAGGKSSLGNIKNVFNYFTKTSDGISKVLKIPKDQIQDKINSGAGTLLNTIMGFVSGFSGGGPAAVPYHIKLQGTLTQTGSITLTSPKTSFSVYASPNSISTAYQAVQNIPWGIFYLNTSNATPEFTYHYTWAHDEYGYPYEVYEGFSKEVNFPAGFFNSSLSINPAIANDISKVEIINGAGFTSISDFDLSPRKIWGNYNSYDVYIGLKITFNNGIIIYQRFPL